MTPTMFRIALVCFGSALLAACGGGGDPITPTPPTPTTYTVGGTVAGLAASTSVVLQNNGGANLTVSANGSFTFATAVNSGAAYAVTVLTQPTGQTCTVASGTGTASANVTSVTVTCAATAPTARTIGGAVSGLATGQSVVLQNNAGSNLTVSANGSFTFGTSINNGTAYAVTVLTQPTGQTCSVTNGTGTATANVTNVAVACVTPTAPTYTIGGTASGLGTGSTVVLQNNAGNNLTVAANGSFTFTTPLATGAAYAVTRLTNPTLPGAGQTCTVTNGTGTVAAANVTSVVVTCVNNDTVAPTVTATTPQTTIVGTPLQGAFVTVTFSEPVNAATVNGTSFTVTPAGGSPVAGTVAAGTGNTWTFTPTSPLAFDTEYTATVTTAVRDPSGNAVASQSWTFNTGKQLAVGYLHTCTRLISGGVKCWGSNGAGQLGYGDTTNRGDTVGTTTANLALVNLGAGRTAVSVVAGDYHTCAILDDGTAKCWGENTNGELGQGLTSANIGGAAPDMAALQPINLGVGRKVIEIAAGQAYTCARLDTNALKCWGLNNDGQLGQGNTTRLGITAGDIAAADSIDLGTGLTPVTITLGHYHSCALLVNGAGAKSVKCWGNNQWGELGRGDFAYIGDGLSEMGANLNPIDFGTLTPKFIMASAGHTCAILSDDSTRCWGLNTWGQLGRASGNSNPVGNKQVCSGGNNDCIGDQPGEMGSALQAAVPAGQTVRLSLGFRHACALRTSGALTCWGSNEEGQIGLAAGNSGPSGPLYNVGDAPNETFTPTSLKPATVVTELSGGGFHTCVRNGTTGAVNCWGQNDQGQLGRDNNASTFVNLGDDVGEMPTGLVDVNYGGP